MNPTYRSATDLGVELDRTLSSCVPSAETVALVDFPNYPNVGDSAIWLGTMAALRRLGCRVAFTCDRRLYSRRALERRLPAGSPILLQGGGNFGDLWPEHQLFRERVIADFPDRPIVQMPVSIAFQTASAEEQARATLQRHERLTILCRDAGSRSYASENYRARVMLCPDAALGLARRSRPRPTRDVTLLARTDKEALEHLPQLPGVHAEDWTSAPGEPGYRRWWERGVRLSQRLQRADAKRDWLRGTSQAALRLLFRSLARQRLEFGYQLVGSGRVLVTDRLHGHILALLLGVPHVVVETGYGKVRGFYEAFSRGFDRVLFCEHPREADASVRVLLDELPAQEDR